VNQSELDVGLRQGDARNGIGNVAHFRRH
jgi:hypothetical protein